MAALWLASPAMADEVVLDLASTSELVQPVTAGVPLDVMLINTVPTARYSVTIERRPVEIPALPVSAVKSAEAGADEVCKRISEVTHKLRNVEKTETGVARLASELRAALASDEASACDTDLTSTAKAALEDTRRRLSNPALSLGEELVVTVKRSDVTPPLTWKATFTTGPRGSWTVSYGLAFSPDDDKRFFARPDGEKRFLITAESDRRSLAFVPAVFFSWLPRRFEGKDLVINVAGGLGFNNSEPAVFLGPALTWNRNVALVTGVGVRKQLRLRGRYADSGQEVVSENLNEDQLHEGTYRPGAFAALTFRFEANPFKKEGGDKSKAAAR